MKWRIKIRTLLGAICLGCLIMGGPSMAQVDQEYTQRTCPSYDYLHLLDKHGNPQYPRLQEVFPPPEGFRHRSYGENSFPWALQNLPLKPDCTEILRADGKKYRIVKNGKERDAPCSAVVQWPILDPNRQCIDTIIGLYTDWLYQFSSSASMTFQVPMNHTLEPLSFEDWQTNPRWYKLKQQYTEPEIDADLGDIASYQRFLYAFVDTTRFIQSVREVVDPLKNFEVGHILIRPKTAKRLGHAYFILNIADPISGGGDEPLVITGDGNTKVVVKNGKKTHLGTEMRIRGTPGNSPWKKFTIPEGFKVYCFPSEENCT